jgi:hypothetical protein
MLDDVAEKHRLVELDFAPSPRHVVPRRHHCGASMPEARSMCDRITPPKMVP